MIHPSSTITHYEVVSALGKDGMGEVWRARNTKLGREVPIKTLPEEFPGESSPEVDTDFGASWARSDTGIPGSRF